MQVVINKNDLIQDIRRLNVYDRLSLLTDIWDEIKESQELEMITEKEKALLLVRLENYHLNPHSASDWKNLRQEAYDKYAPHN